MPNLDKTPLETVLASAAASKRDQDEDEVWDLGYSNGGNFGNIHSYLEEQRVSLERKIGLSKLLKVYRLVADVDETEENVDYSVLKGVLGPRHQRHIDDIIQLVVADSFF